MKPRITIHPIREKKKRTRNPTAVRKGWALVHDGTVARQAQRVAKQQAIADTLQAVADRLTRQAERLRESIDED